jgi:hypothetical protein
VRRPTVASVKNAPVCSLVSMETEKMQWQNAAAKGTDAQTLTRCDRDNDKADTEYDGSSMCMCAADCW